MSLIMYIRNNLDTHHKILKCGLSQIVPYSNILVSELYIYHLKKWLREFAAPCLIEELFCGLHDL